MTQDFIWQCDYFKTNNHPMVVSDRLTINITRTYTLISHSRKPGLKHLGLIEDFHTNSTTCKINRLKTSCLPSRTLARRKLP